MSFLGRFGKSGHESKDPEERLKAVAGLEDQPVLARLAMEDPSPRVRRAAVNRVSDQALLEKIALDGCEIDARVAAVEKIESQRTLAEIIKVRKNFQLMGACFSRITDRKILEAIAYDAGYNMSARRMAIANYADESLLAEVQEKRDVGTRPKTPEEIDVLIAKYGGERLARALGKFRGSPNAIVVLGRIVEHGGEAAPTALDYIAQGLAHANQEVAAAAHDQLRGLKDADLIARLIGLMEDSDLHDKILAVLREIDHPDARQVVDSSE
jgi:hypothetical protein